VPLLIRVARADELPEGASRVVCARGRRLRLVHVDGRFHALAEPGSLPTTRSTRAHVAEAASRSATYRVVLRGPFVHVALDDDRERAPADVHENSLPRRGGAPARRRPRDESGPRPATASVARGGEG
jgi:hypothetical protein